MQSTGKDRGGFYISTQGHDAGITLNGQHYENNDGDDYVYCQWIVNSKSINMSPFSQLKVTFKPSFGRGEDGWGGVGRIYLMNKDKNYIKRSDYARAGFLDEVTIVLDVSDVNIHTFFRIEIESMEGAYYGESYVQKIEFVK